ncbi:MAG TPA: hypothetical protein VJN63_07645 [Thermoplasmata archaeon]|nr:hypothetical protein [Thermoplasmata archaeon]
MAPAGLKVRAAEWLYRWNLSLGILGIVFTILTFLGVFTLLLRPVFSQVGLSDLQTALILLLLVVAVIIGFGVFLDKIVRFWAAQATVATVRNPFLVDVLYQKELLSLRYVQLPLLRSVRALLANPQLGAGEKAEMLVQLDRSIAKLDQSIRDKRWPVEADERVY